MTNYHSGMTSEQYAEMIAEIEADERKRVESIIAGNGITPIRPNELFPEARLNEYLRLKGVIE